MRITRTGPAYLDAAVSMARRVSTITSSSLYAGMMTSIGGCTAATGGSGRTVTPLTRASSMLRITNDPSANGTGSTRDSAGRSAGFARWKISRSPAMQMAMAATVTPMSVAASEARGRLAKGTALGPGSA